MSAQPHDQPGEPGAVHELVTADGANARAGGQGVQFPAVIKSGVVKRMHGGWQPDGCERGARKDRTGAGALRRVRIPLWIFCRPLSVEQGALSGSRLYKK